MARRRRVTWWSLWLSVCNENISDFRSLRSCAAAAVATLVSINLIPVLKMLLMPRERGENNLPRQCTISCPTSGHFPDIPQKWALGMNLNAGRRQHYQKKPAVDTDRIEEVTAVVLSYLNGFVLQNPEIFCIIISRGWFIKVPRLSLIQSVLNWLS